MFGEEIGWYIVSGLILIPVGFFVIGISLLVASIFKRSWVHLFASLIFFALAALIFWKGFKF